MNDLETETENVQNPASFLPTITLSRRKLLSDSVVEEQHIQTSGRNERAALENFYHIIENVETGFSLKVQPTNEDTSGKAKN